MSTRNRASTASKRCYGPERAVETLTYSLYEELLAEVACLSDETQRHYANMQRGQIDPHQR